MSEELKDQIPHGLYCYTPLGDFADGSMPIKTCPFWSIDESKPEQQNGYCSFLKKGDWMDDGTWLLWDQVKECNVNDDVGDEYYEELCGDEPIA